MSSLLLGARILLAAVFATAGVAKLLDRPGSRSALVGFGVPGRLVAAAAILLPLAELAIAIALVPASTAQWAGVAALLLLGGFIAGIAHAMRQGQAPDCHCFGQIHSAPAGRSTLIRNAALAALAGLVVVEGPGPELSAWIADRTAAELVAVGTGAAALALAGLSATLWLSRRDIERELADARERLGNKPAGLPVGAIAPNFALRDLAGETQTLESLRARGLPVLLAFVSADCGPCQTFFPELGRWSESLPERLTVVAITRGNPEDNRPIAEEHGITTMLLQEDMEVMQAYRTSTTPTVVVINPDGTIASPVVNSELSIEPLIRLTLERTSAGATQARSSGRV